jgi:tetratricopeptide (TPR) repeat protein
LESGNGSPSGAERAPASAGASRPGGRFAVLIALAAVVVVAGTFVFTRLPGPGKPDHAPGSAATGTDSTFVIAVTPFWGDTEEATAEGRVMQALVERQVHEQLGGEDDVRILGKELTRIPRSHKEAQALGEEIGATAVIWGEVLVLRGDVDIQPYISMVRGDPVGPLPTGELQRRRDSHAPEPTEALEVRLDAPDQISVRKGKAEDIGNLALLMAAEFCEKRDPDRALALLRRINPPSSASVFAEGQIFREQDDWDTAADRFRRALEMDPSLAEAHESLGAYHGREKDWDAQLRAYETAASLAPDRATAWRGVAQAHQDLGDDDAAEVAFRKAIEVAPDEAGTYHWLGHFLDDLERFDESEAAFARSIDLAPESSRNHVCFGSSYSDRGRYEKALAQYEAALEVNPDASDALCAIGTIYRKQERYDEALAFHRRAVIADIAEWDKGAWEHHHLALTLACAGRPAEAEAEFRGAVVRASKGRSAWLASNLDLAATLMATKGGDAARRHAADFTKNLENDAFRATLLRYYAGTVTEDSVWAATQDSVPKQFASKQCEAFYYLGVAHLHGLGGAAPVQPDTVKALEYFDKCLETEIRRLDAYDLARASFRRLSDATD